MAKISFGKSGFKFTEAFHISVAKWIFYVSNKGMFLAHFNVVLDQLLGCILCLYTLNFVFVGIFRVLVEQSISIAV